MNRTEVTHIAKYALALSMSVLTIIMLEFNLVYLKLDGVFYGSANGFSSIFNDVDLFEDYEWVNILLKTYSVLFLFLGIAGIPIAILSREKVIKHTIVVPVFVIVQFVCMLVYMVAGMIARHEIKSDALDFGNFSGEIGTSAFIPFIIGAVLFIAYLVICEISKNLSKTTNEKAPSKRQPADKVDLDAIDALKKCKHLLDEGALTDAEFERIKNELLNRSLKPD
ncbi:MAG: SHOCT domain-containing protein [Clostridiales bacterium]|nr:SHOCT domain-containing protein [Clostridiales bacterium]